MRDKVKDILLESIQVKEELLRTKIGEILEIAELMIECIKKGGKEIIFVNAVLPAIASISLPNS